MPSEEYLRRVTVGGPTPLNGPVTLVDYDPAWPEQFARQAGRIRAALGSRALAVEHVGSTAVPGLCAKPVLDILLLVADPAREAAYLPDLERAGYPLRIREPDWFGHRMCKGADPAVDLHIFAPGCPEAARMVAFRDRLRACPADRDRYARAKRALAARRWDYLQGYADAKSQVVAEILAAVSRAAPPAPGAAPPGTPGSGG